MTEQARPEPELQRLRVEIQGAVQGVGFRPFVYRLATELALTGWVINDSRGVLIETEGPKDSLTQFLDRLPQDKPPRALIQNLDAGWLEPAGFQQFEIRHSQDRGAKTVLILPDIATCPDCLKEIFDQDDRRHGYPFTNCTNCGPRFTIIQALPYDRPHTTMRDFKMCPTCQVEYDNPLDRRFHAQPNACSVCGPQLEMWSPQGQVLESGAQALYRAVERLKNGQIVAVKGLGGFHLMVGASDERAVARLRKRKGRLCKPFALMARDLAQVQSLCRVSAEEQALLVSPEAPIVLLERRGGAAVAENVAPGNPRLGIMLPYTPLHHLLSADMGAPLVATSGNLSDEPICTDENEAVTRLGQIADLFLVHNRPIARHADDSIVWVMNGQPQLLRRARGYAPLPILLERPIPTILGVGAHLKNNIALSVGRQLFVSQHIGDLETVEAMAAFEQVTADFIQMYGASPEAIAYDLHPDYLSTRWAKGQTTQHQDTRIGQTRHPGEEPEESGSKSRILVPVQHHHAHLAACLAENKVSGPALGVTWDGTGYGPDGSVWGGEFLLGDAAGFTRVGQLRPFKLPGAEAAVREPRRVALALLWEIYGETVLERDDLLPIRAFTPAERRVVAQMLKQGINAPVTSSAGRLFDGIAALLGLFQRISFEGQAAMALEFAVDASIVDAYPLPVVAPPGSESTAASQTAASQGTAVGVEPVQIDWEPLIAAVLDDLQHQLPSGIMAARFHNALAEAILTVATLVGQNRVALSGGCFQNRYLTERTASLLGQAGFEVLLHRQIPPNDGCISLGQVVIATARLEMDGMTEV